MSYTEIKSLDKKQGEEIIGDFTVKYDYETEKNQMPEFINARAEDGKGKWLQVNVYSGVNNTVNINFPKEQVFDAKMIESVLTTIQKISKTFDKK